MEIERGNSRCLYLHVLINTDPNNNNNKLSQSHWQSWKRSTFGQALGAALCIAGGSVASFKQSTNRARTLPEPWSDCVAAIPNVALETRHYAELASLWRVTWKIFSFPFLSTACGVTGAGMWTACLQAPTSKCLVFCSPGSINWWLKVVSFGARLGFSVWLLVLQW